MPFALVRHAVFLVFVTLLGAQTLPPEEQIRRVLLDQQEAWNRGAIRDFMAGYEESQETTFVGKAVVRGYDKVLERYLATYSGKERMGRLTFSNLEIQMLSEDHASVLGAFHLDRTETHGGPASGIFTLLMRSTPKGWKIILDHTS
jgi:ketosteroid isomerase-like protein